MLQLNIIRRAQGFLIIYFLPSSHPTKFPVIENDCFDFHEQPSKILKKNLYFKLFYGIQIEMVLIIKMISKKKIFLIHSVRDFV